jgi:hypothetical protein
MAQKSQKKSSRKATASRSSSPATETKAPAKGKGRRGGLEHTQGGVTTRDDAHDLGVPMLPGEPDEPVGPEDALGEGPKRGDYTDRLGDSSYQPHETIVNPDHDPSDPESPATIVVPQRPRAQEIGDVAGKKGGVETTAED